MHRVAPDPELQSLVRETLAFLFTQQGAQIASIEKLPGIGNGQIFIRVREMVIRVIQKEGSITVLATPTHKQN